MGKGRARGGGKGVRGRAGEERGGKGKGRRGAGEGRVRGGGREEMRLFPPLPKPWLRH